MMCRHSLVGFSGDPQPCRLGNGSGSQDSHLVLQQEGESNGLE